MSLMLKVGLWRRPFLGLPAQPWGGHQIRYVIAIMCVALFLIWDILYNQGDATAKAVREVHRIVRMVTD